MPAYKDFLEGLKQPVTSIAFDLGKVDVAHVQGSGTILASGSNISSAAQYTTKDTPTVTLQGISFQYDNDDKTNPLNATFQQCSLSVYQSTPTSSDEHEGNSSEITIIKFKVLDDRIDLSRFQFQFQPDGKGLKAYAYTPRFQLHSIGAGDNEADLAFLIKLFAPTPENQVIKKYTDGAGKNAADFTKRFNELDKRWKDANPYGAMMAYYGATPVAMITMGGSGRPGVAELAIISIDENESNPDVGWNRGIAKELGMLLFVAPTKYRQAGYKLGGEDLKAIMATARPDNGSAKVMDDLGIPERDLLPGEIRERYGAYRRFFEVTVDELEAVAENTQAKRRLGL